MDSLTIAFDHLEAWIESFAIALLHVVWQASLVALLLAGVLRWSQKATPNTRYWLSMTALATVFAAFMGTWLYYGLQWTAPEAVLPAFLGAAEWAAVSGESPADWTVWYTRVGHWASLHALEICLAWLGGVLFFVGKLSLGWGYAHWMIRHSACPAPVQWQIRVDGLCEKLGIYQRIRLLETRYVSVPALFGWWKPVILLPIGLLTTLPVAELEAILAHELAHARRHDFALHLVQSFMEAVLFFHPAVWWISSCIDMEREQACDDLAIATTGGYHHYVKALAHVAGSVALSPAIGLVGAKGQLVSRIQRIFHIHHPSKKMDMTLSQSRTDRAAAGGLLLLIFLLLGWQAGAYIKPALQNFPSGEMAEWPAPISLEDTTKRKKMLVVAVDSAAQWKYRITTTETGNGSATQTDTVIYFEKESVGVEAPTVETITVTDSSGTKMVVRASGKKTVYLLDNRVITETEFNVIDPAQIKSVTVIKDPKINAQYGEGIDGVVKVSVLETKPLYIVNGKIVDAELANGIPVDQIASVDVLKGETATAIYGDKAKHGVVQIVTGYFATTPQTGTPQSFSIGCKDCEDAPLFIVDDQKITAEQMKQIDPANIEKIEVLKGESATKMYGEAGKNGVILITMKKNRKFVLPPPHPVTPQVAPQAKPSVAAVEQPKPNSVIDQLLVYPNPSKDVFRLQLNLKEEGKVKAEVFNTSGQRMAVLQHGKMTAGVQQLEWNATGAPKGLYLIRIQAGKETVERKVVLE